MQAYAFDEHPGGKGLNQAVAGAPRLEGEADQRARLGSGRSGDSRILRTEGVDTEYVEKRHGSISPRTAVLTSKNGSYAYVGWKNEHEVRISNAFLHSPAFQSVIETASAVLLTLEPPRDTIATVLEVVARSKRCRHRHGLAADRGPPLSGNELRLIDYLIATRWELENMLEDAGDDDDALSEQDIVDRLLLAGVGTICVLGPNVCRIYGVPDFVQPPPPR